MDSGEIRQTLDALRGLVDQMNTLLSETKWQDTVASIDATLRETEQLLREVRDGTDPVRRDLQRAMEELTDAARAAQHLMNYLERHPEALLRGKGGER